jgi:GntP family gluconate:H+ symporter
MAAVATGFIAGMDTDAILSELTGGFGNTLKSIGIVIALGTIIGTFLENSGGAKRLAAAILRIVGEKRSALAMNITGFIVSVPVFCDSGFVILASLNKALSKRTGTGLPVLAVALATGLYATHVFVPPTPGPLAAAATLGADIGLVILFGLIVAIPSALSGLAWGRFYASRIRSESRPETNKPEENQSLPSAAASFAPLLIPVVLIALYSVAKFPGSPMGQGFLFQVLLFAGHPVTALLIGVFLSFFLKQKKTEAGYFEWVSTGIRNAGAIILITGAGGAFGAILRATEIGGTLGAYLSDWQAGILLPFLIAAFIKSAQGSSTVAIITTAALVSPLLAALGLDSAVGKALAVLAIGAGSMTVSHLNDSYFWVVAQFSDMDTSTALRCHTMATLIQGMVGITAVAVLAVILL